MKKKIKLFIKIVFIFTAFYIIFQKIDINELKNIKFYNPFFFFLAFILYNASQIISALRVHIYLKNINVTPSFKKQLMLYYVGMFYNILLPGGIGGDAYKAYKFQKAYKKGYKKILKALLIDRISGLFAIMFLIGVIIFISSFRQFIWLTGL
ncbi:MAG: lysylphosphatidylglycerol synthase transmembrane domain-containing protein, partial [Nautiliaceae bacterium]